MKKYLYIFSLFFAALYSEIVPRDLISSKKYMFDHPESFLLFKTSNCIQFKLHPLFGPIFLQWIDCKPNFVMSINNGRIYGKEGVVITPENQVIKESAFNWSFNESLNPIFQHNYLPDSQYIDATIANISFTTAWNYYHWMLDILPKLELLKEANIEPNLYYLDYTGLPFQTETLIAFGILDKIYCPNENTHIKAKTLILTSTPEAHVGCPPHWAVDLLRNKFLSEFNEFGWRKIYISRKGASCRRILNEDQLIDYLSNNGFEIVQLEKLTVREQAKLFNEAKIIIGPHGAGFTNMIFCNPQVKIIEIYPPEFKTPCFWNISRLMKLEHHCIQSNNIPNPSFDMIIDINQLLPL
jgi:hypothetical protein